MHPNLTFTALNTMAVTKAFSHPVCRSVDYYEVEDKITFFFKYHGIAKKFSVEYKHR